MAEEMTVIDTWVTVVPAIDHLLGVIEAHPEAECHRQGTGGGALAPHAALSTEKEGGEVGTAKALYGAFHPLPGNQGHMVIERDQFPGAIFLGQGQGLHQCIVPPHQIPHLRSVQVINLCLRPGLGHCLVALVMEARKVWFPTGMALLIQLGSRFPTEAMKCILLQLAIGR